MKTLLIDFETTGLDTNEARIIEVGAQVIDAKFNVLQDLSCLVWDVGYPIISQEIHEITGIDPDILVSEGIPFAQAMERLGSMVDGDVKYVVAHNAEFDEAMMRAEVRRHNLELDPKMNWILSSPWLCSMRDLESNNKYKSWKLAHLALEYMVPVDPRILHRAINDVELMRQMLLGARADFALMKAYKETPWIYLRAKVRKPWEDNSESTNKAKARGYAWERAKGDSRTIAKSWVKKIKASDLNEETNHIDFSVEVLGDNT